MATVVPFLGASHRRAGIMDLEFGSACGGSDIPARLARSRSGRSLGHRQRASPWHSRACKRPYRQLCDGVRVAGRADQTDRGGGNPLQGAPQDPARPLICVANGIGQHN
jgi:hypothetical protein